MRGIRLIAAMRLAAEICRFERFGNLRNVLAAFLDFTVEVVRRLEEQHGFAVQPRRWVVERTFAWLLRWRRLVRDYEQHIDMSQNMWYIAMGSMLMHRIFFC